MNRHLYSTRSRLLDCHMNNRRPPRCLLLFSTLAAPLTGAGAEAHPAPQPPASSSPFLGGVPAGQPSPTVETITVVGAITRAIEHNLGTLLAEQGVGRAEGARWRAL